MHRILLTASAAIALTLTVAAAVADNHTHADHADHAAPAAASDSTKAYAEANHKMHSGMAIDFSGDADIDFARGMIPHHQGAVDMAEVQIKYGKDPELRKLAEDIVKAQKTEIAFMEAWLKKHAK